jgi:hypothetical protein
MRCALVVPFAAARGSCDAAIVRAWVLFVLAASVCVLACPPTKKSDAPPTTCAHVGDTCTFAPGKLGLCIEPADGSDGLICQSQH